MLIVAFILIATLLLAAFGAARLMRPARIPVSDPYSMKAALERRVRDGAEFRF